MTIDAALAVVVSAAVQPLAEELRELRGQIAALQAASPSRYVNLVQAAELLGISTQTARAMCERGDLRYRRAGRRILVEAGSLRVRSPGEIVVLARAARGR